jgi:hypothetical protein
MKSSKLIKRGSKQTTGPSNVKLLAEVQKNRSVSIQKKSDFIVYIIGIVVSIILILSVCFFNKADEFNPKNPNGSKEFVITDEINFTDEEYRNAVQKKLSATIKSGWFTSNDTAYIIEKPDFNHALMVKKLSSHRWPAVSHALEVLQSLQIFHWDLSHFSTSLGILPGCRVQFEPVFVLGNDRDKGGMLGSSHDRPLTYANLTLGEFLRSTFQGDLWLYWTGELSYFEKEMKLTSLGKTAISSKITWKDFMVLETNLHVHDISTNDDTTKEQSNPSIIRPMLWLSHPGVVSQTHYDTQHNIFLQIQGMKRFHLFPPETELYLYPNIHRSYRQSQIHFEDHFEETSTSSTSSSTSTSQSSIQRFHLVNNQTVEGIEIILSPGDILYIPPYWQHRVESLTLSLSMSIVSPSEIEAAFSEIFWMKVPFGLFQYSSRMVRSKVLQIYFEEIFLLLVTTTHIWNGNLFDFMQSLYEVRFAPLFLNHSLPIDVLCPYNLHYEDLDNNNNNNNNQNHQHKEEEQQQQASHHDNDDDIQALDKEYRYKFMEVAKDMVLLLTEISAENAIKITFLRDYFEQLSRWAVGPQYTHQFIRDCFI